MRTGRKDLLVFLGRAVMGNEISVIYPTVTILTVSVILQIFVRDMRRSQLLQILLRYFRANTIIGAMDHHLIVVGLQDIQHIVSKWNGTIGKKPHLVKTVCVVKAHLQKCAQLRVQQRLTTGDLQSPNPVHDGKYSIQRFGEFLRRHLRTVVILRYQHATQRAFQVAAHGGGEIQIIQSHIRTPSL